MRHNKLDIRRPFTLLGARNPAAIGIGEPSNPLLPEIQKDLWDRRTLVLNDDVTEDVIEMITLKIMEWNEEDDEQEAAAIEAFGEDTYQKFFDRNDNPIKLYLHTDGGDIMSGLSICSAIKSSRTPVHTIALGKVSSMGFIILICGQRRFCQRYARLMYHQLLANPGYQKLKDFQDFAEHCGSLQETLEEIVKEHTLIPQESLDEVFVLKHDLYLDAEEALDWGCVDELI